MDAIDFNSQYKDGDIIVLGWLSDHWIIIYSHLRDAIDIGHPKHAIMYHAAANVEGNYTSVPEAVRPGIGYIEDFHQSRLATNKEIETLMTRMRYKGKTWDFEHKTIIAI